MLGLNAIVLTGAILFGVSLAEPPSPGSFAPGAGPAPASAELWAAAAFLFSRNMMVVGVLLLGACTFGILTLMTLGWNGYHLGFGLGTLHMASPERAMWVLLYVPIEFTALLIASTAAMELSRHLFCSLVCGHDFRPRVWEALGAAACMLAAAAVMEVVAARGMGQQ